MSNIVHGVGTRAAGRTIGRIRSLQRTARRLGRLLRRAKEKLDRSLRVRYNRIARSSQGEAAVADVFDVSDYILSKTGPVSSMKLQKLAFYSQAWSLVWDERPIFANRVEAWANGPVVPDLFHGHRGEFMISEEPKGDRRRLTRDERETVDAVLETYGDKSANWLSALTHSERPWIEARKGLADGERGSREITHGQLADFYANI